MALVAEADAESNGTFFGPPEGPWLSSNPRDRCRRPPSSVLVQARSTMAPSGIHPPSPAFPVEILSLRCTADVFSAPPQPPPPLYWNGLKVEERFRICDPRPICSHVPRSKVFLRAFFPGKTLKNRRFRHAITLQRPAKVTGFFASGFFFVWPKSDPLALERWGLFPWWNSGQAGGTAPAACGFR